MTLLTEIHPLQPFLPINAKVLMLGSFPPPNAKWKMDFYYPNFQNDMWRIFGLVFFDEKDYFLTEKKSSFDKEKIIEFLSAKGIAVGDTAHEVHRLKGNASDNFLQIVTPLNLESALSKIPDCSAIITTGEKATETLRSLFPETPPVPKIGSYAVVDFLNKKYKFYRMPSSSRAYPKPLTEKAEIYRQFFVEIDLL
ncbi:MAG: uracil-DNA glycosylase family protein [Bacteroidia bacterium]|nr:uracil-DNA glycosylase family protein [Bacteroidia bacterium]